MNLCENCHCHFHLRLIEYTVVMPNNVALATVLKAIKATTFEYKSTVDSLKLYKYDTVKRFVRHHIGSSKQQSRSLNSSSIDGDLCRLCSEGKLKEAVGILEQQDIQDRRCARSVSRNACTKCILLEYYDGGLCEIQTFGFCARTV